MCGVWGRFDGLSILEAKQTKRSCKLQIRNNNLQTSITNRQYSRTRRHTDVDINVRTQDNDHERNETNKSKAREMRVFGRNHVQRPISTFFVVYFLFGTTKTRSTAGTDSHTMCVFSLYQCAANHHRQIVRLCKSISGPQMIRWCTQ